MAKTPKQNIGHKPLDIQGHEDTLQDFETILGFPCEGLVHAWGWEKQKEGQVTEAFLGKAKSFLEVIEKASKLKNNSSNVLIMGESGTGKELLAHFIHQLEGDLKRPFVAINCGAIPDSLIESELFGSERGAFTGAESRRAGQFEAANGGTIFLDEIGTLKMDMQVKLLRVLEDKKVKRLGGKEYIQLNFRTIAATNENLKNLVDQRKFREDLYYRLTVISLPLPPLRERTEDIPLLIDYFIKKYHPSHGAIEITPQAMELLTTYRWPGNIRELENLIQQLVVLFQGKMITVENVASMLEAGDGQAKPPAVFSEKGPLKKYLIGFEKETILKSLDRNRWNISAAAKELKISRTTLHKKIKDYQLSRD